MYEHSLVPNFQSEWRRSSEIYAEPEVFKDGVHYDDIK